MHQGQLAGWITGLLVGAIALHDPAAIAQITPDSTLGSEASIVSPNVIIRGLPANFIQGGAIRETNLFHSFLQFNIANNRALYFANPGGIRTIISRVTGNTRSEILGRLGVLGPANLILLNPNGIVFGPQSSLDLGGSFIATTANSLQFRDRGTFSATQPTLPSALLTVDPSAFLFQQPNPAPITNQGFLGVAPDKSLLLVGGNIELDYGVLRILGGRIELGGLSAPGSIGITRLSDTGDQFSLQMPSDVERADITLLNQSVISTLGFNGGAIALRGRNLTLDQGSFVISGILVTPENAEGRSDAVVLDATNTVRLDQSSAVLNLIFSGGSGTGGDVQVTARSLEVNGGSRLDTSIFGRGTAGDVVINASDRVQFDGFSSDGTSAALSLVHRGARGQAGDVRITTQSLEVTGGAQIDTSVVGRGIAGNVVINASDQVRFDGFSDGGTSAALSIIARGGEGEGGDIRIATRSLEVTGGAQLDTSMFGRGTAGNVVINASDQVRFDGVGKTESSGAYSVLGSGAVGQAGDVQITTDSLAITNQARLNVSTFGTGDAGNIDIQAQNVEFNQSSGALSLVGRRAIGNGGQIAIQTGDLSILNGSLLSTNLGGRGKGGSIAINAADAIRLGGTDGRTVSAISSQVEPGAVGQGGDIAIAAASLALANGAQLAVGSFGFGNGGTITVNTTKQIDIQGTGNPDIATGIFSNVEFGALGDGGKLSVTTDKLTINNLGGINSNSFSVGKAGDIDVTANSISLDQQGLITSSTNLSQAGNITLNVRDLLLMRRGSRISTSVNDNIFDLIMLLFYLAIQDTPDDISAATPIVFARTGDGGNITINSRLIVGIPEENSDIAANAGRGNGGRVTINAQAVFGLGFRSQLTPLSDITASSDLGIAGTVAINTLDTSFIQNSLTQLPQTAIATDRLLANSCIVRRGPSASSFQVTGSDNLPWRPTDLLPADFPTGVVRSVQQEARDRTWKPGDPIVEPQGIYRLGNGQLVMSRDCPESYPSQP